MDKSISAVVHAANSTLALVLQIFLIEQVRWAYVRNGFCFFLESALYDHLVALCCSDRFATDTYLALRYLVFVEEVR